MPLGIPLDDRQQALLRNSVDLVDHEEGGRVGQRKLTHEIALHVAGAARLHDQQMNRLAEENELGGVITVADFNNEDKLGRGKEMVDRLSSLIGIFEQLDLSGNRAEGDDLLGDALYDLIVLLQQIVPTHSRFSCYTGGYNYYIGICSI